MLTYVKTILLSLAAFLAFLLIAPQVSAQQELHEKIMNDKYFNAQPPITEPEVLLAIELISRTLKNPSYIDDNLVSFSKENKVEPERMLYALTKVSTGMMLAQDPPAEREMAAAAVGFEGGLPTNEELAIIKKHSEDFNNMLLSETSE